MSAAALERLRLPEELEPPSAVTVAAYLRRLRVEPHAWSNGPGARYAAHDHAYTKVLMCAAGNITFLVGSDGVPLVLEPGDGFVLPPGMRHAATVGPSGVTCLEGQRA